MAITSGTTPRMKAKEVIRIGRSRRRQASVVAWNRPTPASPWALANSTISMAFLQARPTSTTKPICTKRRDRGPHRHSNERTEQTHRHHEDDRQRKGPAFIQRGQRQEHKHDRQGKDVHGGAARLDLHQGQLGPLGLHGVREGFVGKGVHQFDGLARADARPRRAVDRRRRVEVVASDHHRAADFAHVGQRAQWYHLLLLVADFQQVHLFDAAAKLALGLEVDLPGAAELVEVVDVGRAQVGFQGVVDAAQGDAQRGSLGAIDVQVELRGVGAEEGEHALQIRAILRLF